MELTTTWSPAIKRSFAQARPDHESDYYGPYNTILHSLFPDNEGYVICPQHKMVFYDGSVDFLSLYVVESASHPVFFMEIKPKDAVELSSSRERADDQMRQRYGELYRDVQYDLHSASCLGNLMCFYVRNAMTKVITPRYIPRDPDFVTDPVPRSLWTYNVSTPSGEAKLREVAGLAKAALLGAPGIE
jgi:hypothetical protein